MSLLAGVSSHSARIASVMMLNGLTSANCRRPSGIDSTGTNADEANVSGKITMKPIACADSPEDAVSPTSAKNHDQA